MNDTVVSSKRRMRRLAAVWTGVITATFLVVPVPAAEAADFECNGPASGQFDNVVVPPGSACLLINASVLGSVRNYGSLNATQTSIVGNVEAEPGHFGTFITNDVEVGGNVHIKGGSFTSILNVHIFGNFQYSENNGGFLQVINATIGGNAMAEKNSGGGNIVLSVIGGNLECSENSPPIFAAANSVGGNDETCPG